MSDLISKKAVMEELLAIQDVTYMPTCLTVDECKGKRWMIARAIDAVKDAPTVDAVEVVHGEWNEVYEEDEKPFFRKKYYCSNCGDWNTYGETNYCPNCGAKMDEVSE